MTVRAALVLAGSRPGGGDPLALAEGVSHKALVEVAGATMLARVVAALRQAGVADLYVCADDPAVVAAAGRLGAVVVAPGKGPSRSVAGALSRIGTPLLVTTADHALLRADWVRAFVRDAPADADVAVLLAARSRVEAAVPGTRRTYLRFADGAWSGCNLFLLRTPQAAGAIALWERVERDRKRPWRIVGRLGAGLLFRYLAGRLSLAAAVSHLGRRAGVAAAMVEAADGLAAVDVDTPADLATVRAIVARVDQPPRAGPIDRPLR